MFRVIVSLLKTRKVAVPGQAAQAGHAWLPEQPLSYARDAHRTAGSLGFPLATFKQAIMDAGLLANARRNRHLLATDSKDLPESPGQYLGDRKFYLVDRENLLFKPIGRNAADDLIKEGRSLDVLCVNKGAAASAKGNHPVVLWADYDYGSGRWCLIAYGCSDTPARVVVWKTDLKNDAARALRK